MTTTYGDTEGTLEDRAKAQTLTGGASSYFNALFGEASSMYESRGGNDVLTGGASSFYNTLYGEASSMYDSRGGNDVLTGGASSFDNTLYGDASLISKSQGGNDVLTGGASSFYNTLYGDAASMYESRGGNDLLTGGASSSYNALYGDAFLMFDSQGGHDILVASDRPVSGMFVTQNLLYGDAKYNPAGNVDCGNDRLVSGTGNDDMWGDIAYSGYANEVLDLARVTTGQDVFVFSANNGTDTIHDFRQGEDKIELQGIGVDSFDALKAASHLNQGDTNTVITFGSNTITVIGATELTAADFLFT